MQVLWQSTRADRQIVQALCQNTRIDRQIVRSDRQIMKVSWQSTQADRPIMRIDRPIMKVFCQSMRVDRRNMGAIGRLVLRHETQHRHVLGYRCWVLRIFWVIDVGLSASRNPTYVFLKSLPYNFPILLHYQVVKHWFNYRWFNHRFATLATRCST